MAINEKYHPDAQKIKMSLQITEYLGYDLATLKSCRSPLRIDGDTDPSFSVFMSSQKGYQLAKDYTGETYDVVRLHIELTGCSRDEACRELASWDPSKRPSCLARWDPCARSGHRSRRKSSGTGTESEDLDIGKPSGRPLKDANYLRLKQLTVPGWVADQLGCYRDTKGNLCYKAENGSVHIRGGPLRDNPEKTYKRWSGPGWYSTCGNPTATEIYINEGFGDFIALLHFLCRRDGYYDYWSDAGFFVILNSTSYTNAVLANLEVQADQRIYLALDADKGGDKSTAALLAGYAERQVQVIDIRQKVILTGYKDVLASWQKDMGLIP